MKCLPHSPAVLVPVSHLIGAWLYPERVWTQVANAVVSALSSPAMSFRSKACRSLGDESPAPPPRGETEVACGVRFQNRTFTIDSRRISAVKGLYLCSSFVACKLHKAHSNTLFYRSALSVLRAHKSSNKCWLVPVLCVWVLQLVFSLSCTLVQVSAV